jgi:hypothetical protein
MTKINHFPGMSEICRKDSFARHSHGMQRIFLKDYDFIPKSWILPEDSAGLDIYIGSKSSYFYCLNQTMDYPERNFPL